MSFYVGLLDRLDELYRAVVEDPQNWNEEAFATWVEELTSDGAELPRDTWREVRRALRVAERLARFWADATGTPSDAGDWRTRVDIAMGPKAWRPLLEIARHGLDEAPSPELFDQVRKRFREVNATPWPEGTDYRSWLAARA